MESLKSDGFNVEAHDDRFPQKTKDVEWLPVVAKEGRVAFSKDKRMRSDELEIACIMNSGAKLIIAGGKQRPDDFAKLIIRSKAQIDRYIRKREKYQPGPFIAKLTPDQQKPDGPGAISTWLDKAQWQAKKKID